MSLAVCGEKSASLKALKLLGFVLVAVCLRVYANASFT